MVKRLCPPPSVVYIDVDGTLLIDGQINEPLVDWLREAHRAGYQLVLWSSAGEDHARQTAAQADLTELFHAILSKPGYVVDDMGWRWVRYTQSLPVRGGARLRPVTD